MTVYKNQLWLLVGLLITAGAPFTSGQEYDWVDNSSHDLQFFSPVNLDFDDAPIGRTSGYFFRFDKLSWAATGERNTVGNKEVTVLSELIVPDALSTFLGVTSETPLPTQQYEIINGLQDVAPTADFGWGERYEFGYRYKNHSWDISILDGPLIQEENTFGNGPETSGFGSIHVNFAAPTDFLRGFRDYWGSGEEVDSFVLPTEVFAGPGQPGDNIVDDLDGDGAEGAVFIVDPNDTVIGIAIDLDDLHMYNVTFNQLTIRNSTETKGIEIMHTHYLTNRHHMAKHQNNHLEFGYGVRFLRLRDEFRFDGTSDLLGTMNFSTGTENQIVGPQVRLKWSTQRSRWNLAVDGRCQLGYNIVDLDHAGSYGLDDTGPFGNLINQGLVPGGIDRLIGAQPNTYSYGRQDNEFSPVVELRADLSYQLTGAIAARLGYTALFIDNISRASQVTNYSFPDLGLLEGGNQEILLNGANFGFDVVY